MVKNPPTNAEDTGLIPGPGRFPHAVGQLSSCITTTEPKHPKVCALQQDKPWQREANTLQPDSRPLVAWQLGKAQCSD